MVDVYGARLEIRVPQQLREQFHLAARARHLSQSEAGRIAIEAFIASTLDAVKTEPDPLAADRAHTTTHLDRSDHAPTKEATCAPG